MCHIRNYCEFDEDTFFQWKAFLQRKFFQQHKLHSCQESLQYCGSGMVSFFPTPLLPGHCPALALPGLLPHPEGRAYSKSKEERGQVKSSPLPCFGIVGHPRPAFILTRDYFKAPKSSLTKSFPNTLPEFSFFSMSQSLLVIQSSALQPCGISFLLYPQNMSRYWCSLFNSFLWCIWKCIMYT